MKETESKKEIKNKRYTFRMTKKEAEVLEAAAKRMNIKPSEVARMGVFAVGIAAFSDNELANA